MSVRTPPEACFSPRSSAHGVAVLGAGRGLAPPHWHSFPPGQRPLLQVSVLGGTLGWGKHGENLQDPGKGRHIWGGGCLVIFVFPLAPVQR